MIKYFIISFFYLSLLYSSLDVKENITIANPDSIEKKYIGGWPTNKMIDTMKAPSMELDCPGDVGCECVQNKNCNNNNCIRIPRGGYCMPTSGDLFPRFIALDQFEEYVNIYDFAYQGKYIFIEMGATWCEPCRLLANWLSYDNDEITKRSWWKDEYNILHEMINNGDVYFITVLYEDEFKDNVSYDTLYEWYDNYPDDNIPILADSDKFLHTWLKPTGIPAITLLNDKMEIVTYSNRGLNHAFDKFLEIISTDYPLRR